MNTNYVAMVKHDLDKLLVTRFIVRMEKNHITFPHGYGIEKSGKLRICLYF
jgi:hypothetical protein